jgi:hypothetical protein
MELGAKPPPKLIDACRALIGTVARPADPLWPLHIDVARQSIAVVAKR